MTDRKPTPRRSWICLAPIACALALVGCASTEGIPDPAPALHRCRRAVVPPQIDGRIEAAWQRAETIGPFLLPGSGEAARSATVARLLWDDQHLYLCYEASDLDVWSTFAERDSATCQEDVLEAFLMPGADSAQYVNFEINALGTIYDAYVQRAGFPMGPRWQAWNCAGIRVAVRVLGTLNDGADQDRGWTLEVAIPFASLPFCRGRHPAPGDEWLFHVARYDYSLYLPAGRELSSCAPLSRPAFHNAAEWLSLRFE